MPRRTLGMRQSSDMRKWCAGFLNGMPGQAVVHLGHRDPSSN